MMIEQDTMTSPFLPTDIAEAESAAEECLRLASALLMLVEESQSDAATSLGEWRDQLSREGAEALIRLLAAVQRLEKVDDSLFFQFADAFDDPALVAQKSYGSFHAAAHDVAGQVLHAIWTTTDHDGRMKDELRTGAVTDGWIEGCRRLRDRYPGLLPNADIDLLLTMIGKEAIRVAAKRTQECVKARYLGNGKIQIGDQAPITLEKAEDFVIQALVELQSTGKAGLVGRSGVEDAPRVLRRIREKHSELVLYITLPGRRGKGGYRTSIQPAD